MGLVDGADGGAGGGRVRVEGNLDRGCDASPSDARRIRRYIGYLLSPTKKRPYISQWGDDIARVGLVGEHVVVSLLERGQDPMDAIDRTIVSILQDNGRTSNADLARHLEMAPSAVHARVRKLEETGVIQAYPARVNPESLNLGLLAFVFVGVSEFGQMKSGEHLAAIPQVLEVHHVAGEDSWLVKVRARNPAALGRLLNETIGTIENVTSTRTTIVLDSVKESMRLPVPDGDT